MTLIGQLVIIGLALGIPIWTGWKAWPFHKAKGEAMKLSEARAVLEGIIYGPGRDQETREQARRIDRRFKERMDRGGDADILSDFRIGDTPGSLDLWDKHIEAAERMPLPVLHLEVGDDKYGVVTACGPSLPAPDRLVFTEEPLFVTCLQCKRNPMYFALR